MKDWGFDGIDVDWEYPAGEDEASFFKQFEKIDHINLMAYDYAGSFSATTGHTANLYTNDAVPGSTPFSSDTAIKAYLAAGVPSRKLVLGIPLYGRSFENTDGLGQNFTTSEEGSWEKGTWGYKELPRNPSAKMFCDQKAEACYSYDPNTKELISFDIPAIVEKKVAYIKELGLAGSMFWEASGDRSGSCSLIGTSHSALGSLDSTKNWLDYPASRYDNIRESRLG
ncbi:hypothetical protein V3481_017284 [Fusarium oxysporum f. sp. vasinfectum]